MRRSLVRWAWFGALAVAEAATPMAGGAAAGHDPRLGPSFAQRARPMLGSDRAPVVVVEMASFKCTHCRAFHEKIFPRLREQYIEPGRVQWVILNAADDPSEEFAPVFAIARCALRQGKYWDLLDTLFQAGNRAPSFQADFIAKHPRLDRAAVETCRQDRAVRWEVATDFDEYRRLQARGTPTFLVQKISRDGSRTSATIAGAQPLEYFQRVFDELLKAP